MREIEIENWARRPLYEMFSTYQKPYFSLSAKLDLTAFLQWSKREKQPFFPWMIYLVSRAANEQESFRLRIRGAKVIEHDIVHPSFTIMKESGAFGICRAIYQKDAAAFVKDAVKVIDVAKTDDKVPSVKEDDDLLFMTSIPWFSFNDISHAMKGDDSDCVPRIAWGKYEEHSARWEMTIAVQMHHALADGVHIAAFLRRIQELLDRQGEK